MKFDTFGAANVSYIPYSEVTVFVSNEVYNLQTDQTLQIVCEFIDSLQFLCGKLCCV